MQVSSGIHRVFVVSLALFCTVSHFYGLMRNDGIITGQLEKPGEESRIGRISK